MSELTILYAKTLALEDKMVSMYPLLVIGDTECMDLS
jgi:hypothetical protein